MDKTALVEQSKRLVVLLDEAGFPPRGAVVIYDRERDNWRLWIVPAKTLVDKHEFYRQVSTLLVEHEAEFPTLDVGNVDLRFPEHSAIVGLSRFIRAAGINHMELSDNVFNGFYLPDCIVIRMAL